MSNLSWKVKGQPWPSELINSNCLIRFNISSENNDFGFNSIQKNIFSKNFPFKCIRKQTWPWRKVGQGQPRIMIWANLVGPTSPMLHTKSQGHWPSGSGVEDFLRVFTIYGHGGHLGHVTRTIWTNFRSRVLRSLHMKFEFNWPSGFREEDVWKCWRTDGRRMDGRRSDWYTISSPMSLRLRWAKKQTLKILMRRLIRSSLIWIYTVCKCVRIYLMSEFNRLYPTYPHSPHECILEVGCDSEIQGFPTCIKGQTCRHTTDHVVCCSPHLLLTLTVPMKAFLRLVVMVRYRGSLHVYRARPAVILRTMWCAAALIYYLPSQCPWRHSWGWLWWWDTGVPYMYIGPDLPSYYGPCGVLQPSSTTYPHSAHEGILEVGCDGEIQGFPTCI